MANLTLLHLYPKTLRLNGEAGNVLALEKRAELYGIKLTTKHLELGQLLPKVRPNLIFIGSGTLQATLAVAADLVSKDSQIHKWIAQGTKVIAVGSGFDLISQELILADASIIPGLALTNTTHRITGKHLVGEVVLGEDFAGFINTDREIIRGGDLELGVVKHSDNPELVGYIDGYCDGKVWATNVQGPFLPMNPKFADAILASVSPQMVKSPKLKTLNDLAKKAREAISARVGH